MAKPVIMFNHEVVYKMEIEDMFEFNIEHKCDVIINDVLPGTKIRDAIENAKVVANAAKKDVLIVFNGTPLIITEFTDASAAIKQWQDAYERRRKEHSVEHKIDMFEHECEELCEDFSFDNFCIFMVKHKEFFASIEFENFKDVFIALYHKDNCKISKTFADYSPYVEKTAHEFGDFYELIASEDPKKLIIASKFVNLENISSEIGLKMSLLYLCELCKEYLKIRRINVV